jgi:hypothetical protein
MFEIKYSAQDFYATFKIDPFSFVTRTDGRGLWSDKVKDVRSSSAKLYLSIEDLEDYSGGSKYIPEFGELRVSFPKKSWDVKQLGLIYTDEAWLKGLRQYLETLGFSKKEAKDVDYSEQGMQGNNYVSLDAGKSFIKRVFANLSDKDKNKIVKSYFVNSD